VVDHGLSLGISFRDPDGNGVEVSYELSASAIEPTEADLAVGHERAHIELGG
jgi:catechol-2,3-dioxygenase